MARKKTIPIDVRQYKSVTSIPTAFFRGVIESVSVAHDRDQLLVRAENEPPLVSFDSNGKISQIQAMPTHEEHNDCFEFKSTWISQWVASNAQGVSPTDKTGLHGSDQESPKLTPAQKTGITKRHGTSMKKYTQTSMRFKASSQHEETETRPKQAELPPLDPVILELAKQEPNEKSAGRKDVLKYWQDSRKKAARGDLEDGNEPLREDIVMEGSQQSSEPAFEQYVPSTRQTRPQVAALTSTQADNVAHRNCTACYKSHYKCDRTLPRCKQCGSSDIDCVYLNVSPSPSIHSNSSDN
jgi:hypothetical protein